MRPALTKVEVYAHLNGIDRELVVVAVAVSWSNNTLTAEIEVEILSFETPGAAYFVLNPAAGSPARQTGYLSREFSHVGVGDRPLGKSKTAFAIEESRSERIAEATSNVTIKTALNPAPYDATSTRLDGGVTKSHYAQIDFRPEYQIAALQVPADLTAAEHVGWPVLEGSGYLVEVLDREVTPGGADATAQIEA